MRTCVHIYEEIFSKTWSPNLALSLQPRFFGLALSAFRKIAFHMFIFIWTYIHTFIHSYIHTYMHTYIHSFIHTYMHSYIHAYIHTFIHSYKHTCIRTCIRTYIHSYIHTYIHAYIHSYIQTYIHTCTHTYVEENYLTGHLHRSTTPLCPSLYLGSKWSPTQYYCNDILTP